MIFLLEMQHKTSTGDGSKQVISFNDKSALLAQIRHNLTNNKGFGNSRVNSTDKVRGISPTSSGSALPDNPNLSHFAKQLATLAQKSAADLLTEVGVSSGHSDIESNGNSSNSGMSPKRSSSLLDPKARALPSASLPKKVATVSPNLSKARIFTSNRPTAAVEPMTKHPNVNPTPIIETSSIPSIQANQVNPPSTLSALSALSASPLGTKTINFHRSPELSSDLGEFNAKNDIQHSSLDSHGSSRSSLFDKLSLASQLEGYASCTSNAAKPTAESLKDLLKTTTNTASENVSNFQWNSEQPTSSGINNASWPDYSQWNNGQQWNGASTSNQVNWQWPQQEQQQQQPLHQQLQLSQGHSNFASVTNNTGGTTTSDSANTPTDVYGGLQYSNNFDTSNQWSHYNSSASTAASSTYPSHSLPPAGNYSTSPYFPTSYLHTPAYSTYPQTSQTGYTGINTNYHNQYSGHGGNDFTPNYSQPYPGSFSQ